MENEFSKKYIIDKLLKNNNLSNEDKKLLINMINDNQKPKKIHLLENIFNKIFISGKILIIMLFFIFTWILFNSYFIFRIDKYPFGLLNLIIAIINLFCMIIIIILVHRNYININANYNNSHELKLKMINILEEMYNNIDKLNNKKF